jgi:hypothetical protein
MNTFTPEEAATTVENLEKLIDDMNAFLKAWSGGPTDSSQGVVELRSFRSADGRSSAKTEKSGSHVLN